MVEIIRKNGIGKKNTKKKEHRTKQWGVGYFRGEVDVQSAYGQHRSKKKFKTYCAQDFDPAAKLKIPSENIEAC